MKYYNLCNYDDKCMEPQAPGSPYCEKHLRPGFWHRYWCAWAEDEWYTRLGKVVVFPALAGIYWFGVAGLAKLLIPAARADGGVAYLAAPFVGLVAGLILVPIIGWIFDWWE